MKKIKKSIVLIMTAVLAAGIFSVTGKMSEDKVYADDPFLDIEQGKTLSLDLNQNRSYSLVFKAAESGFYQIYSTGSNDVDCEFKTKNGSSYDPQIIDKDSGSYYNFKLKVYLEAGRQCSFMVYLPNDRTPVNANDTKVRIDKYVDNSEKVVAITTKNFPDIIFRVFVGDEFDADGDGYLSKDEISYIKSIDIKYDSSEAINVKSVKGIEYLTSLESLTLTNLKDMSEIDLSKNTALKNVSIVECDFPSINLKNLTRLTDLTLDSAPIKSIDLSSATSLKRLDLSFSDLTSLDLSKQTELDVLDVSRVNADIKNLKNCSKLRTLEVDGIGLTSFDLTGLSKLESLRICNNELTKLDLSPCKELKSLDATNNKFSSVNLKGLKKLSSIWIYNNNLKSIDLTDLEGLESLDIHNNPLTELDISKNLELVSLLCHGSDIKTLDISYNEGLQKAYNYKDGMEEYKDYYIYSLGGPYYQQGRFNYYLSFDKTTEIKVTDVTIEGVPVDEAHFPDKVLRSLMSDYDFNNDGVLVGYELRKVNFIRLDFTNLQDLSGIEYLPCLNGFSVCGSKLTSLDLSKCPNLENVYCSGNNISSVKLNNPKLVTLVLANNQITSLDLSKEPLIETLNVSNNKLSSLDLSGKSALSSLSCFGNNIKTLDIIGIPELIKLLKTGEKVDTGKVYGYLNKTLNRELTFDKSVTVISAKPTATPTPKPSANPTADPSVSLTLNKKTTSIICGKTQTLKATVKGSDAKVTWKSSDTNVATVDSTGKIKTKMAGKVTITATAAGKSAKCTVTVLYKDVTDSKDFWFTPTNYLTAKNVVRGYAKQTEFRPANKCTRAQMVTFLYRLQGEPKTKSSKCKFSDVKKTDYFYKPVIWATEKGITTGVSKDKFAPQRVCTRAQTVTFLWRMANKPEPKTKKNPFPDVKKSDYFYKATLWASEKKILVGMPDGTFNPQGKCLRRQMVTFLYKYDKYVNGKG